MSNKTIMRQLSAVCSAKPPSSVTLAAKSSIAFCSDKLKSPDVIQIDFFNSISAMNHNYKSFIL